MKSTTASLIITALASTAIAQPHGHHQHQHPARAAHQHHHKRDLVTEWDTVWVTETVTEVVDGTTTEWFTPTHSAATPSTTLATVTSSADGGQFFEGSSALPSSSAPQVVAPAPVAETPSSPPAVVAPAPVPTTSSSSSSVYVAPQPTVAPVETPSPAPVAPKVETPAAAAPSVAAVNTPAASANTGSTVNTNSNAASVLGSGFKSGDLTYYTVGLGACGEDDSGKDMSENIVAMSSATMGSQSNGNPMCGKTIKIFNAANGKSSTGIIHDKCPGCGDGSIDVSQKLFEELADLADGRIDISWNWAS